MGQLEEVTATGTFKRYHRVGYFGEVDVRLSVGGEGVSVACSGDGFQSQGHIEGVPEVGYEHWKSGAIRGVHYALHCANAKVAVTITRIAGLSTDTNPTTVAVAAARAVWSGLGWTPSDEDQAVLLTLADDSWNQPVDAIPDLPPG